MAKARRRRPDPLSGCSCDRRDGITPPKSAVTNPCICCFRCFSSELSASAIGFPAGILGLGQITLAVSSLLPAVIFAVMPLFSLRRTHFGQPSSDACTAPISEFVLNR
jgi:hypothetical protein